GERGDERLSLARLHLADHSLVEDHAADELHVVVAHFERALAAFAANGERLDHEVVDRRAVVELLLELERLGLELRVTELQDRGLELVDLLDERPELFDLTLVRRAKELLQGPGEHSSNPRSGRNRNRRG